LRSDENSLRVVLCALVALCAFVRRANAVPPPAAVTPERVKSAIGKLQDLTNKTLKVTGVPGIAIAMIHRDRVVYKQGFGVREAGKPQRIDADAVFQVASMSKPIASTVLAVLVGKARSSRGSP
jgi:CubicO group peptidase (beta-lactamase class C family)